MTIEVFFHGGGDTEPGDCWSAEYKVRPSGWYWWFCEPGCIPDGDPVGPFATEEDAQANAED